MKSYVISKRFVSFENALSFGLMSPFAIRKPGESTKFVRSLEL